MLHLFGLLLPEPRVPKQEKRITISIIKLIHNEPLSLKIKESILKAYQDYNSLTAINMSKKLLTFTERMDEMIKEIQQIRGLPTMSAVIYYCIAESHAKAAPAYTRPLNPATAEDKLRKKQEEKKAKEDMFIAEQTEVCQMLGGSVEDHDGFPYCVYHTYFWDKAQKQEIPLKMVTTDMLKNQYTPSKEVVLKALEKAGTLSPKITNKKKK